MELEDWIISLEAGRDTDENVLHWTAQAGISPSGSARKINQQGADLEQIKKDRVVG